MNNKEKHCKFTKAWSISSSVGLRRPRFGPDLPTRSSRRWQCRAKWL